MPCRVQGQSFSATDCEFQALHADGIALIDFEKDLLALNVQDRDADVAHDQCFADFRRQFE